MKNKIVYISLISMVLSSCVPGADKRWAPYEREEIPQEERSTVLVEEYTGGKCTNCPSAARSLLALKKKYKENLVIVSLHPRRTGLAFEEMSCKEADEYAVHFEHSASVPGAMINRKPLDSKQGLYSQNKSLWPALIHDDINSRALYRLELDAEYTAEKKLKVKVLPKALGAEKYGLKLQLWLVEDFKGYQKTPKGLVEDYFHHNVLRKALNGAWGEDCHSGKALDYVFDFPENVVADNAKVVAYIYEADSRRVLEAAIKPLGNGISSDEEEEGGGGAEFDVNEAGFFLDGARIVRGSEIKFTKAEKNDFLNLIEMENSPIIVAAGDKWSGEYIIEFSKLNNMGKANGGLSQVCMNGVCLPLDNTEKFSDVLRKPQEDDFIQIHYAIPLQKKDIKADYKVKVSLKKAGKEIFHFTMVFSYSPS